MKSWHYHGIKWAEYDTFAVDYEYTNYRLVHTRTHARTHACCSQYSVDLLSTNCLIDMSLLWSTHVHVNSCHPRSVPVCVCGFIELTKQARDMTFNRLIRNSSKPRSEKLITLRTSVEY